MSVCAFVYYRWCQNYRTEPGVQKYGKIPYLRTPPDPDSARIRIRSIIEFLRSIMKFPRSIISGTSISKINYRTEKINYRTKMGNVGKMGENRIIEQQRSDKNYEKS